MDLHFLFLTSQKNVIWELFTLKVGKNFSKTFHFEGWQKSYDKVSDVPESGVRWRAVFQSGF